jgi:hypothetical protein
MTKSQIEALRKLAKEMGAEDVFEDRIQVLQDLKDWTPLTFQELKDTPKAELANLMSYCWHDGRYRCDTIGISDVVFKKESYSRKTGDGKKEKAHYWSLKFSDSNGEPSVTFRDMTDKFHNVGDGEWNYGVYKKKKTKKI